MDGSTQDSAGVICNAATGPHPEIVLDAAGIGGVNAALWLDNGSSGSEITGLSIINAPGPGIFAYTSNNTIDCNYVGIDFDGTTAAGNGAVGVFFQKNGVNPSPSNNVIGGTTPAQRNVVSSNTTNGIAFSDAGTTNNVIEGNYIGTDANGTAARPNGGGFFPGVLINNGASGNTVGGTTAGVRNVISGNTGAPGVQVDGSGSRNNIVEGNYIGVDSTGLAVLANGTGILLSASASNNTFGGTTVGARNVISGNSTNGIQIDGSGSNNNVVEGNYIGTDITGAAARPNGASGILISAGAQSNTIGGTTAGARNIISGGANNGIAIANAGTSNNVVIGNYIGTDATGTVALGNALSNVAIFLSASNNRIGGTTAGERNIISASGANGVTIHDAGTTGNTVEGNYIGTDVNGTAALPNTGDGVLLSVQTTNNTIGGTASGAGNVISGNTQSGVNIRDSGTTGNIVAGNLIGSDKTGTVALPNAGVEGVVIFSGAANNTIGGTSGSARNIISGNSGAGINIDSLGTDNNVVEGNFIGTNISGTAALPNGTGGVAIFASAKNNTVGGTSGNAHNVISGNASDGIGISAAGTTGNVIEGNFIGTNASGSGALGNGGRGIIVFGGATGDTIGGTAGGTRNLIAFNTTAGVAVADPTTNGISIRGNSIHDNSGLGIDLGTTGVTPNDPGDGDAGSNNLQNFPVISTVTASGTNYMISGTFNSTASTTFTLDFYANTVCDPSGNGQGNTYMGSTTVTGTGGNAPFGPISLPAVGGQQVVTSTATDPGGNTSEFSNCLPGPVVAGAAPAPEFAPEEAVVPTDALTITLNTSEDLVVTDNESLTLTATITNTSSSEVDDVSIRMQAADAFDVLSTETSAGTAIIDCQLASLQLPVIAPGQIITITADIRVDPSVPSNGEADNVVGAVYKGGRLKTAGHKVQLLRRGSLPSTGYPPPADLPVSSAVLFLVGMTLLGGTVVVKRAVGKRR